MVDATDPAGREDRDPGRVGGDHRGRDRGGRPAAAGERRREARPGRLAHRTCGGRGQSREGGIVEADEQAAFVDRDRRRDRAGRPDRGLGRLGDLDVLRVRQAVADQSGFEGDHRPALGQGRRDFGVDGEAVEERGLVSHGREPTRYAREYEPQSYIEGFEPDNGDSRRLRFESCSRADRRRSWRRNPQ